MNLLVRTGSVVALSMTLANTVAAGPFPPIAFMRMGYSEASMQMLDGTANLARRKLDHSGYLAVSADFNADGKMDEARILVNPDREELRVVAVIQSATKIDTYVLKTLPINALPTLGISLAPAGTYEADCAPCAVKPVVTSRPGIMIFEFDGKAQLKIHPSDNTDDGFESFAIRPR